MRRMIAKRVHGAGRTLSPPADGRAPPPPGIAPTDGILEPRAHLRLRRAPAP
jgi:hypothetical protein